MSKNELVSIIIPNYNHARYLANAIESALAQTYKSCEVIVLDDGSTDNSYEVAMHFGDHIRYIRQENRGLAAARNAAIRAGKGKYIALLDADDMYESGFVAASMAALNANRSAQGVYTGYSFIDQHDRRLAQQETRVLLPNQLHQSLLYSNFLVPACVFFERQCYLESNLFDENLSACADWDMWLRLSHKFTIMGIAEPLVRYRIVVGSMSSNPQRMIDERLAVLYKHVGPEPKPNDSNERVRRAYAESYFRAVIEFLQNDNSEQAETYLHRAAQLYPQLIQQRDTLYELLLGGQARGMRGELGQVNIDLAGEKLLQTLDSLIDDPETGAHLATWRNGIYAQAYSVLATVHYAADHFTAARRYLIRSALTHQEKGINRQNIAMFAKSLLGVTLMNRLRRRNWAASPQL